MKEMVDVLVGRAAPQVSRDRRIRLRGSSK
jgi:hypothetical protein